MIIVQVVAVLASEIDKLAKSSATVVKTEGHLIQIVVYVGPHALLEDNSTGKQKHVETALSIKVSHMQHSHVNPVVQDASTAITLILHR